MKKNRQTAERQLLIEGLNLLDEAFTAFDEERDPSLRGLLFDGLVKRFEVAFEASWKLLQTAARNQGKEVYGPKQSIQEGVGFGWITSPEHWADALDARNGSVHNYFNTSKENFIDVARIFLPTAKELLEKIA